MLGAHLWTIAPRLRHALRPRVVARDRPWATEIAEPRWGSVRVTGRFTEVEGSRRLAVLVHGLGGCTESHYLPPAVESCTGAGLSCLRLNLRGSDLSGEDFYHAGLVDDLRAALADPELDRFEEVVVWGFSLGGHVALRYGTEEPDPRVRSVIAVCAPLDLELGERNIDRVDGWLYRQYLLQRLRRIYRPYHERRGEGISLAEADRIKTIREWDEKIVAPRHGFDGALDYYARASVAGRVEQLAVDALLVANRRDPMVTPDSVPEEVVTRSERLDVRWSARGGHVAFPADLDLGVDAEHGLEPQILGWIEERWS